MKRIAPVALAAMVACSLAARGQWVQTTGPSGALITGLAADGSHTVASAFQDIYNYDDDQWRMVGSLKNMNGPYAVDGNTLLMAHGVLLANTANGIARSTDYGTTWSNTGQKGSLFGDGGRFYTLSGDTIYSSSDGAAWSPSGIVPPFSSVPTLFGDEMFTTASYGLEIDRSTDGGANWMKVEPKFTSEGREPTAGAGVRLSPAPGMLYASIGGGEIYRSSDGTNWTNITKNLPDWLMIEDIAANGTDLLINTNQGIFRFTGTEWNRVNVSGTRKLFMTKSGALIGTTAGVFSIPTGASEARSMNQGLIRGGVYALGSIGETIVANGTDGIYRTTDRGNNWQKVADFGGWNSTEFTTHNGTMFAINGLTYRSTDSGATWEESGPKYDFTWQGPEHRTDVTALASDGNALYVGVGSYLTDKGANGGWASGGLWRSTDDGSTWNAIDNGLPYATGTTIPIGGIVATKGYLLVAAARGSIYRSTNGGNSWSLSTTGLQYDENFAGSGQLFQVGGTTYLHQNGATYQSTDGGITWGIMSPALPDGFEWTGPSSTLDDKFYTQTFRRLGDTAVEYHLLMLEGGAWNDISSLQPDGVRFGPMVRAGNYIYAGSFEHGVWKEYLQKPDISSSVTQRDGLQEGMELAGYPNPTTATAEVRYNLAERSQTVLSLVNSIGEEVERMDMGVLQAGEHASQLDMRNLPAGAYMLRLTANGHARHSRIIKVD